ncbi:MAG: hypothetical protein JNK95_04025, partial [Candidatus Competibacter sp.]|nr:hypothetical protein [Candidatus Competibacter sp.]MDS4058622.1 hypothetical protein [Candidatus Contendobacter sp.]
AAGEPDFTPATAADRSAQARAEALADPDFRAAMAGYARTTGWAEEGGHLILKNPDEAVSRDNIAGRTQWLPNSPWWAASTGVRKGFTEAQIQGLVQQFQRGEAPRTARETRFLDFLIEDIADENARNEESAALERELTPDERDRLDRAEQEARAWLGEDRYEALLETLAKRYPDASPATFNRALLLTLEDALEAHRSADLQSRTANRTGRDGAGASQTAAESPGAAVDETPLLAGYSPADLAARDEAVAQRQAKQAAADQAAAKQAAADQARSTFVLTGSDRPADVAASRGQGDLLAGAKPAPNKPSAPRSLFAQASRPNAPKSIVGSLVDSKPWVIDSSSPLAEKHGKELRDAADAIYRTLEPATNPIDKNTVRFVKRAFKEMRQHSADERVMQIVPSLRELFERATPLWVDADDGTHGRVKAWHHYGVRTVIEGKDSIVRLVARELDDGTLELLHHDADVRDTSEVKNALANLAERSGKPNPGGQQHSSAHKDRLLRWLENSQPPATPFARASTPATLTANLKALAGDALVQDLLDNGRLVLIARQDQLPTRINIPAGERVAGAVDPQTGQVYLVAENIRPGEVQGVLLHEIGVHQAQLRLNQPKPNAVRLAHVLLRLVGARQVLGEASFADVLKQLERLRAIGHVGVRAAFAQAEAAMTALGQNSALLPEEALAYLVQSHPQLSVVQRIIAAVRAFLYRAGFRVNLTEHDLRALALSALKGAARQDGGRRATVTAGARGRNADDAEAQRQYDAVVKRYQGTPQWMKAPNGEPTKLTERQWVQVRT